jgi:hypothetical protein
MGSTPFLNGTPKRLHFRGKDISTEPEGCVPNGTPFQLSGNLYDILRVPGF